MEFPSPNTPRLPHEIECISPREFPSNIDELNRIIGSLVGLAVGDALGASVEFRPHQYFVDHPVHDMEGGGTWGLDAGQWTDDTSMALCLASSLIDKKGFDPYDQMVRYKWWYKHGYMSSTGRCFDIGNATRESLEKFARRQKILQRHFNCFDEDKIDNLSWNDVQSVTKFNINCSSSGVAGNGALMRLAPVPLFFYQSPIEAVKYAGRSARFTHGDKKAVDACRYYAALIVAAVRGERKSDLLDKNFYETHRAWFGTTDLHDDILRVAHGSYQRPKGYEDGIRGTGYIVNALEAALWALWSDNDSFKEGALAAVNLGDDTDTTAAIYGQLAGAVYGYQKIPQKWLKKLYARELLVCTGKWLHFEGNQFSAPNNMQKTVESVKTPVVISPGYYLESSNNGSLVKHSDISPTWTIESNGKQLRTGQSDVHGISSYQQQSRMHGSTLNPSDIGPAQMYQLKEQKISISRLDTPELLKHFQNSSETHRHQSNDIQVLSPRSGAHQSSDHYSNARQPRTLHQYDEQSLRHRAYDYRSSDHDSNVNPSHTRNQYIEQSSTHPPYDYQSPGYQSGSTEFRIWQPDHRQRSTFQEDNHHVPAYKSDLSESLKQHSGQNKFSPYVADGCQPLTYDPYISQPRKYGQNDERISMHRSIDSSQRRYPSEQASHFDNTSGYAYGADQIGHRSSLGSAYLLDAGNRRYQSEAQAYIRPRRAELSNDLRPAASYYYEYVQPTSHSLHSTTAHPGSQNDYIIGGIRYSYL